MLNGKIVVLLQRKSHYNGIMALDVPTNEFFGMNN